MNKVALVFIAFSGAVFLQGCARSVALGAIDYSCPSPSKNQVDKNGYLILKRGATLECQVKNYTSKMSCVGITGHENKNGWLCSNGSKKILFSFDDDGILEDYRSL